MLVIMSDTHFAEFFSNQLGEKTFNNNLPSIVFQNYFEELAVIARQHDIQKIDLVLAGDIFEITRTSLWLVDELRPYVNVKDVMEGSALEARLLEILDAIQNDSIVAEILDLFFHLRDILGVDVKIHFIPGNHDRLVNATPLLRKKVRAILGMPPSSETFPRVYHHREGLSHTVLVRHGHEYDSINFGMDIKHLDVIPRLIDSEAYEKPNLGDFITVDVAARLPIQFKLHYGTEKIVEDEVLGLIYERLVEFDNVRPATALMNFLLSTPGVARKEAWLKIAPVMTEMVNAWSTSDVLRLFAAEIRKQNAMIGFVLAWFIGSKMKIKKIPFWMVNSFLKIFARKIKLPSLVSRVQKEAVFSDPTSEINCLVMGHTHLPEVKLMKVINGREKYYINTGAWRKLLPATADLMNFGHLRTLTKAIIFDEDEHNAEYGEDAGWSFDFNSEIGYGYEVGE